MADEIIPQQEVDNGDIPPMEELEKLGLQPGQYQYLEKYLAEGMKLIHGEKNRQGVIKSLRTALAAPQTKQKRLSPLADVMVKILGRLDAAGKIPDLVKFFGGGALLFQVAELGEAAGMEFDEQSRMTAFNEVLAKELDEGIQSGKYDPQELVDSSKAASQMIKDSKNKQAPQEQPNGT